MKRYILLFNLFYSTVYYLATFSSQFTINNITPIEIRHTIMNIAQQ